MKGKPKMAFSPEVLDQLLAGCERPEDILGPDGLFGQLKKALAERALGAELGHHLAQEQQALPAGRRRNHRNGTSPKTVLTDPGAMPLAVPRDRAGTFEPQLVPKHQRRLEGFDAKVLSLYARGLTVREMQGHLTELYGVQDVLLAVVDGLQGFPEAITTVFPQTTVQTCIVHLLRHSLDYATWKERKAVALALKTIYRAPTVEAARAALDAFAAGDWGRKHPPIVAAWRRQWEQVIPLFAHPPEIRRLLYTTNAIESLHMQLRKILKTRGHFPNDEAATKLLYLALRNIVRRWKAAPRDWKAAMNQFAILYPDRFTVTG